MALLHNYLSGDSGGFFLERFPTWMHFDMEYKLNLGNAHICNLIISYVNSRQEKIELIQLLFKENFLDIMPWENYKREFKDTVISVMCQNTFLTRIDIILYFSRGFHDIRIKVGWVRIEHLTPVVFRPGISDTVSLHTWAIPSIWYGPYVILRNFYSSIRNIRSVLSTHLTYYFSILNHSSSLQKVSVDITV